MEENDHSNDSALATLGRLDVADVPNMGYGPWREAKRERESARGDLRGARFMTPIFGSLGGMMIWQVLTTMVAAPIGATIVLFVLTSAISLAMPILWIASARRLARSPDPESLLPSGSSPELAEREHELLTRIEAHNRNVRFLRGMPTIEPALIEAAENEERALLDGHLALAEAKTDIAGLLTDGLD